MEKPAKSHKLQLGIDIALTALFLALIFFFGAMTLATDFSGVYGAASRMSKLEPYLPENWNAWDLFAARISSVDAYLGENIYGADELGYMNSSFQYALGKRMISTGGAEMIRLNSGHLYDLQNYVSMDGAAANILAMRDKLPADTPFLFVYEHPTLYRDDQLPAGYAELDFSRRMADEITTRLRDAGVRTLDSREILPATGLDIRDYLMYTDQHWATLASIKMAQKIAETAREMTGATLEPATLDLDNFDTKTYEKLFLGKYGQRVGPGNIDPDDITAYWPKAESDITRTTLYAGEVKTYSGPFRESVLRGQYLEPLPGKTWNIRAYYDYGLVESYDIYENPDAADCTILVLKDSYSASISAFLSLVADRVVAVDLRHDVPSIESWVEQYQPDIVVVAYSLQMLRDDEYDFQ